MASRELNDELRLRIQDSGRTIYRLSRQSNVDESQLRRFVRGERTLGNQSMNRVAAALKLTLVQDITYDERVEEGGS